MNHIHHSIGPGSAPDPGPQVASQRNGQDLTVLTQQLQHGDFSSIRRILAETRASQDWDDRCFLLDEVAGAAHLDALCAACAAEQSDPGLHLLLGAHYFELAGKSRGARQAHETSRAQFDAASQYIDLTVGWMNHVIHLDPGDPTPYPFIMRALKTFTNYEPRLKETYFAADRMAPSFVTLQHSMVNARAKKWGGSHEEALYVARSAQRKAKPGDDMAACLFHAHFLVWQYARAFDKDIPRTAAYLREPAVAAELNAAFDRWTGPTYHARRSSIPHLHQAAAWYFKTGDKFRLRRALDLTAGVPCESPWSQVGVGPKGFADAIQMAYGAAPAARPAQTPEPKGGAFGWLKKPR